MDVTVYVLKLKILKFVLVIKYAGLFLSFFVLRQRYCNRVLEACCLYTF